QVGVLREKYVVQHHKTRIGAVGDPESRAGRVSRLYHGVVDDDVVFRSIRSIDDVKGHPLGIVVEQNVVADRRILEAVEAERLPTANPGAGDDVVLEERPGVDARSTVAQVTVVVDA